MAPGWESKCSLGCTLQYKYCAMCAFSTPSFQKFWHPVRLGEWWARVWNRGGWRGGGVGGGGGDVEEDSGDVQGRGREGEEIMRGLYCLWVFHIRAWSRGCRILDRVNALVEHRNPKWKKFGRKKRFCHPGWYCNTKCYNTPAIKFCHDIILARVPDLLECGCRGNSRAFSSLSLWENILWYCPGFWLPRAFCSIHGDNI